MSKIEAFLVCCSQVEMPASHTNFLLPEGYVCGLSSNEIKMMVVPTKELVVLVFAIHLAINLAK